MLEIYSFKIFAIIEISLVGYLVNLKAIVGFYVSLYFATQSTLLSSDKITDG